MEASRAVPRRATGNDLVDSDVDMDAVRSKRLSQSYTRETDSFSREFSSLLRKDWWMRRHLTLSCAAKRSLYSHNKRDVTVLVLVHVHRCLYVSVVT